MASTIITKNEVLEDIEIFSAQEESVIISDEYDLRPLDYDDDEEEMLYLE